MKNSRGIYIILILIFMLTTATAAQAEKINLTVRGAEIGDVLVLLTEQTGINLVPDETVQGRVTINLQGVELQEALKTLTVAYGFQFNQLSENIYLVSREGFSSAAEITVKEDLLTIHVQEGDIRQILNTIADKAGINILMDNSVSGKISVDLDKIPLKLGLMNLLQVNGFSLSENQGLYRIVKTGSGSAQNNLSISIVDGKVSIDVHQADLGEVLRTISRLTEINMVLFSGVREMVDLKLSEIPLEEAIDVILSGTRFTYRKVDDVYLIGEKNINSPAASLLTTSELIPLEYLQVEKVPQLLPNNFPAANVKVIKEQNAILVTGTQSEIENLRKYIAKLDTKIPLIVVDALIVEINNRNDKNSYIKMGLDQDTMTFDSEGGLFNYKSILKLPEEFYLNMQSLVSQGMVTIKARPNITTLNGQQATIDVSQAIYYSVVKKDEDGAETTDYQSINTGVSLEVTPWVSSSGEITLTLRPSYSNITPTAGNAPPDVSRRDVNTTVRVKDGNTVVIGGLIQDVGKDNLNKIPILGDIPILGALFRPEKTQNNSQTELVIYITPHVLDDEGQAAELEMNEMLDKVDKVEIGD